MLMRISTELPADRKTLLSSGLVPQAHDHDALTAKGMCVLCY